MTIGIALLVIPLIPDYPGLTKRWWLTKEHQILAVGNNLGTCSAYHDFLSLTQGYTGLEASK